MSKKRINSKLYTDCKIIYKDHSLTAIYDDNGYLYAKCHWPTKILPSDLPEWFVNGYMYKRNGYLSAKGVKYLAYDPNYHFDNHFMKYDSLYISFNELIYLPTREERINDLTLIPTGYDYVISGTLIIDYIEAVRKYSNVDNLIDIVLEIEKKKDWFKQTDWYKEHHSAYRFE